MSGTCEERWCVPLNGMMQVLTSVLALLVVGCVSPMARVSTAEDWNEFVPDDGRFSIRFPAPPTEQVRTAETDGGHLILRIYLSEGEKRAYTVVCLDYPAEIMAQQSPEALLDRAADDAKSKPYQKVVSFERIELGDIPGRAIEIEDSRHGGMVIFMRAYLVGSRMYSVGVTTATEEASSDHADAFFRTFKPLR